MLIDYLSFIAQINGENRINYNVIAIKDLDLSKCVPDKDKAMLKKIVNLDQVRLFQINTYDPINNLIKSYYFYDSCELVKNETGIGYLLVSVFGENCSIMTNSMDNALIIEIDVDLVDLDQGKDLSFHQRQISELYYKKQILPDGFKVITLSELLLELNEYDEFKYYKTLIK